MFKSLHPSIGQLQALDDLCIFCFPQLKNLPNEIGNLKNLTSLRLLGTHSLPPSIGQLQALRELRLWRSAKTLTTLPEEIGNLGNLIFLDLWESEYIKSLPSSIGQLRALQWFDLRDTRQLTQLPDEVGNLGNLIRLDLKRSGVTLSPSIEYALACSRFRSRSSTMDPTGIRFKATRWPIILANATNAFRPNDKGFHPSTDKGDPKCKELRGLEPHDAIYRFLVDGRESFVEMIINRNKQNNSTL